MARGLCADDPNPDRWFPHQGQHKEVVQLKLICGICPVSEDCLLYALRSTEPVLGIWGGTTSTERWALRRKIKRKPLPAKHGLYRYRSGCRCKVCRRANAEAVARARANKKERDSQAQAC